MIRGISADCRRVRAGAARLDRVDPAPADNSPCEAYNCSDLMEPRISEAIR